MRIMLATNNPSKVARVRKQLAGHDVEILTPKDFGLTPIETKEGSDIMQNAIAKANAYFGKVDVPVLGMDSAFVVEGEDLDPAKVKRNALGGRDEASLTPAEICDAMVCFYQDIAQRHGGRAEGYFEDAFGLVAPDGSVKTERGIRPLFLTDRVVGEIDAHFPISSLYILKATGKYVAEQSEAEESEGLRPYREAMERLLGI